MKTLSLWTLMLEPTPLCNQFGLPKLEEMNLSLLNFTRRPLSQQYIECDQALIGSHRAFSMKNRKLAISPKEPWKPI